MRYDLHSHVIPPTIIAAMEKDPKRFNTSVWEKDGKKYMCFWDTVLERYTTCINPMITYKKERN